MQTNKNDNDHEKLLQIHISFSDEYAFATVTMSFFLLKFLSDRYPYLCLQKPGTLISGHCIFSKGGTCTKESNVPTSIKQSTNKY